MSEETPKPAVPSRPRWQRILGLRRREGGKYFKFKPTWWGYALIVGFFGTIGMASFAEYSMKPDFCQSCHLMGPYYKAWHESAHKNVACVDCHFEPGLKNTLIGKWKASSQAIKYITQTYGSKPHAEVSDVSCKREGCHTNRLLQGKVKWTVKSVTGQPVTINFDHTPHLTEERRGKQLRCVSCHSQVVQGQHIVVTLDTCFTCHFKGFEHGRNDQTLGGCDKCHSAPKSEIRLATGVFKHEDYAGKGVACINCHSDSIKGDGAVARQVCWTCHNQTTQVARFSETKFLHEEHVTNHKVECTNCHSQIQHNLTAGAPKMKKTLDGEHIDFESGACGSCHESSHTGPADLYRGVGARGVDSMPSPMFRAQVDCIACHRTKEATEATAAVKGQTFVTLQDSCNYCHQTKYDGTLDTWKRLVAYDTDKAEAAYVDAKAAVAKADLDPTIRLKAERLLDDANHNIQLVKLGHGVHNINYATAALNVAGDRAKEAKKLTAGGAP
jgi:nitrate/TMAO reductase-like tetraheme cytochrome c subunit